MDKIGYIIQGMRKGRFNILLLPTEIRIRKHGYTTTSFYQMLKYVMQNVPAQAKSLLRLTSAISLGERGIIVKLTGS